MVHKQELLEPYSGDKIIVPVSGGKDSTTTLCLAIAEKGRSKVIPVFNDTGWEHPITYEYFDYLKNRLNIRIYRTKGRTKNNKGNNIVEVVRNEKKWPTPNIRFCTRELKLLPFIDWYREKLYDGIIKYEVWFGMRTDESISREKKYSGIDPKELHYPDDIFPKVYNKKISQTLRFRLPIVDWSTDEVFRYLKREGVKRNPLYDQGDERVGCYPCLISSKKENKRVLNTEFGKKRLKTIKDLEIEIGKKYHQYETEYGYCSICNI